MQYDSAVSLNKKYLLSTSLSLLLSLALAKHVHTMSTK